MILINRNNVWWQKKKMSVDSKTYVDIVMMGARGISRKMVCEKKKRSSTVQLMIKIERQIYLIQWNCKARHIIGSLMNEWERQKILCCDIQNISIVLLFLSCKSNDNEWIDCWLVYWICLFCGWWIVGGFWICLSLEKCSKENFYESHSTAGYIYCLSKCLNDFSRIFLVLRN